jgi:hypothetical protein
MERVVKLIDIIDTEVVDKLIYLDRIVKLYGKFLNTWKGAEVTSNGTMVRVKFFLPSKYGFESFTEREFPMEDIDKRIDSYKRKVKKEFKNRHQNERLLKMRYIRSIQKYYEDAKIQMPESIMRKL